VAAAKRDVPARNTVVRSRGIIRIVCRKKMEGLAFGSQMNGRRFHDEMRHLWGVGLDAAIQWSGFDIHYPVCSECEKRMSNPKLH
jgi:hypothetical protein